MLRKDLSNKQLKKVFVTDCSMVNRGSVMKKSSTFNFNKPITLIEEVFKNVCSLDLFGDNNKAFTMTQSLTFLKA